MKAACIVLKKLQHPCGKNLKDLRAKNKAPSHQFQSAPRVGPVIAKDPLQNIAIPKYLVYRHFLAMVQGLDVKARAQGKSRYAFAEPFKLEGASPAELDAIRNEATALTSALEALDGKAGTLITAFRQHAQPAVPPPSEISTDCKHCERQ